MNIIWTHQVSTLRLFSRVVDTDNFNKTSLMVKIKQSLKSSPVLQINLRPTRQSQRPRILSHRLTNKRLYLTKPRHLRSKHNLRLTLLTQFLPKTTLRKTKLKLHRIQQRAKIIFQNKLLTKPSFPKTLHSQFHPRLCLRT